MKHVMEVDKKSQWIKTKKAPDAKIYAAVL